jgi:hypothetical protein
MRDSARVSDGVVLVTLARASLHAAVRYAAV